MSLQLEHRIFTAFDTKRKGFLTFREFVSGMVVMTWRVQQQKSRHAFCGAHS